METFMRKIIFIFLFISLLISCSVNNAKKGKINMNANDYQIGQAVENTYQSFVNGDENKFSIVIIPDSQSYLDFRSQK